MADRLTALQREKVEREANQQRQLAEMKARIDAEIEKDLEELRKRAAKPPTPEEIAARDARILAENKKFMARVKRECAKLDAKDAAESKVRKAKWLAGCRSRLKSFHLSLDCSALRSMSTDITEPVEKRARLVRPRQFLVSSSNIAASHNTLDNATPVRQEQALKHENLAEGNALADTTSSAAFSGTSAEPTHKSDSSSSPAATADPLSYLLNQATTTRLQLDTIESSINSILAKTSDASSSTAGAPTTLTWSSTRKCYELQPSHPADLSIHTLPVQFDHASDYHVEDEWYSARDFPPTEDDESPRFAEDARCRSGMAQSCQRSDAWHEEQE